MISADTSAADARSRCPPRIRRRTASFGLLGSDGLGVRRRSADRGTTGGRYGWSGGQGTDFFVDPDGTIGILLTQVELGVQMFEWSKNFRRCISRPGEPSSRDACQLPAELRGSEPEDTCELSTVLPKVMDEV